jgi:hypothetical protein
MATSTFYATNSGRWHNGSGNMQPTNYAYGWISGNDPCTGRFYAYPEYLGNYGNRYGLVWFDTAAISAAMADQNISGVTLTLRRTDTGGRNPSGAVMGTADKYLYVWGLKLAAAGKGSTAIGNTYGVSKSYVSTVGAKYATYNSPIYWNSTITVTIPAALFTAWLADGITGLMVCDGDDSNVTQGDANHVYGDGMNGRVDNPPPYYDEGSTYGYMTFAGYDNATYKPYLTITHAPSVPNPTPPVPSTPGTITTDLNTFDWSDATDTIYASNELYYEMQLSFDGGSSWTETYSSAQGSSQRQLYLKTVLSLAAGQYYYNANCKYRARTQTPLYGGSYYYSDWAVSGTFTIDYRIPPSVPTSLTPSKANPYEGESISFTVGRPSSYNTHNAAGAVMQMTYYVKLASGVALGNSTEPVTSSSEIVPCWVGPLTSGKSDLSTYIRAYCKDAHGQQGPETGNVAFTVRRFRAPAVIVENVEREEESAVIHLLVTDTGYGGTQSGSQINKIEYRLDGGAWNDATLLGWDGLKNSFEVTGLSAAARYTMEVRAVNNAPAGTSLSDKTGSAHQSLLLEFLPQGGFYKNKTTGVGMVYSRAAIIGSDPLKSVHAGELRLRALEDGWIDAHETWTYASATTITVPSGAGGRYQKGDKIRLKQGGEYKYFYIVSVSDTTLSITGGSDYTLVSAAITDNYYSKAENPQGFPRWFNWSPTFTGFSSNPTNGVYRFHINGTVCSAAIRIPASGAGTSNATTFTISAPVAAKTLANAEWCGMARITDNGTIQQYNGILLIASGETSFVVAKDNTSSTSWTASGTKRLNGGNIVYEI